MHMIDYDDKEYINVFLPFRRDGIGDFMICAGLCPEIAGKYKKKVRLVCHESYKRFNFTYKNTERIYLNDCDFETECAYIQQESLSNVIWSWFKNDSQGNEIRGNDVNFADEFKKYVFGLPLDAPVHSPIIDYNYINDKMTNSKFSDINWDQTVILVPYSNSAGKRLENELSVIGWWGGLVKMLQDQYGYKVYTNIRDESEKPIVGTESICASGEELVFLSQKCKCFIGIRAGLLDLLSVLGANVICISTMGLYHYDLKKMWPDCHTKTCYLCWRFIDELISGIKIGNREDNMLQALDIQIDYRLKPDKKNEMYYCFCLSYEDLTNSILEKINLDEYSCQ